MNVHVIRQNVGSNIVRANMASTSKISIHIKKILEKILKNVINWSLINSDRLRKFIGSKLVHWLKIGTNGSNPYFFASFINFIHEMYLSMKYTQYGSNMLGSTHQ